MKKKTEDRIPLKTVKEIFLKHGKNYSDEQLIAIRDFLYELAEIDYAVFIHQEKRESLFKVLKTEEEKSEYKNAA